MSKKEGWFVIYDTSEAFGRPYRDLRGWWETTKQCEYPFVGVDGARHQLEIDRRFSAHFNHCVIIDLGGKQFWPEVVGAEPKVDEATDLRRQVAALSAEVEHLKDQRRERIATAVLASLILDPSAGEDGRTYAEDAIAFADALIAELDKETNQ